MICHDLPSVHVDTTDIPPEHLAQEGRRLPKGVTVWQIYTDYLRNLHAAAVARIRSRRGADLFDRLTAQDRVQYILTIPAAWQSQSSFIGSCKASLRSQSLLLWNNFGKQLYRLDSSDRSKEIP